MQRYDSFKGLKLQGCRHLAIALLVLAPLLSMGQATTCDGSPVAPVAASAPVNPHADAVNVLDCDADPSGAKDSTNAFMNCALYGKPIYVPSGCYSLNWAVDGKLVIFGDGSTSSQLRPLGPGMAAITYRGAQPNWTYRSEVRNLGFVGKNKEGIGFSYASADPLDYHTAPASELAGNVRFSGVMFSDLDKGIQFPFGNIGSEFYSTNFRRNRYGVYALNNKFSQRDLVPPSVIPPLDMHAGNLYFYAGEMDANDVAVYLNNESEGFGGIHFTDTIIEGNRIALYVQAKQGASVPIMFTDVWLEANGRHSYHRGQPVPTSNGHVIPPNPPEPVTLDTWTQATVSKPIPVRGVTYSPPRAISLNGSNVELTVQGGVLSDVDLRAKHSRVLRPYP